MNRLRKISHINTTENPPFPEWETIDLTNRFYLEISKNVLTGKEYEILKRLLVDKYSVSMLLKNYNVENTRVKQIFQKVFDKVKSLSEHLKEMDIQKERRNNCPPEIPESEKIDDDFPSKKISESSFPFSIRLYNVLTRMGCKTFGDLVEIPIHNYPKYNGFKIKCTTEFISFIEYENMEEKFDGFYEFKKKYMS